ncbi:hypothetical protein [Chitinimonas lacunae]|uniref:Uncharacterized protein n=1 Tax=Chitinimonas lacunae TaxID=1963018 RepID=A0ABV8MMV2_9NEIS
MNTASLYLWAACLMGAWTTLIYLLLWRCEGRFRSNSGVLRVSSGLSVLWLGYSLYVLFHPVPAYPGWLPAIVLADVLLVWIGEQISPAFRFTLPPPGRQLSNDELSHYLKRLWRELWVDGVDARLAPWQLALYLANTLLWWGVACFFLLKD